MQANISSRWSLQTNLLAEPILNKYPSKSEAADRRGPLISFHQHSGLLPWTMGTGKQQLHLEWKFASPFKTIFLGVTTWCSITRTDNTHMHSHGVDTFTAQLQLINHFFLVNNKNTDHAPAHKQDKPAERVLAWKPTHNLCSMRHSRTVATPAESSHVHPTPFFFFSNCLLIHILSRKQQSYTAASFSQHSDTKMEGSNNKQNKVMWLKAGCGAPPSCVQAHPVILRHSRQKQHPKARWLGSCCIYSGL